MQRWSTNLLAKRAYDIGLKAAREDLVDDAIAVVVVEELDLALVERDTVAVVL